MRCPFCARAKARLVATVLLPTPPLALATAITCLTPGIPWGALAPNGLPVSSSVELPDGLHPVLAEAVWRSVEGVARYRITVSDPESNVVFEGDVPDTTMSLRSIGPLVPGETYVWYVDALLADGASLTTGVHSFAVRR